MKPQTFLRLAVLLTCVGTMWVQPALAQSAEATEAMDAISNAFEKSASLVEKWLSDLQENEKATPTFRTPEELGYLNYFSPLHALVRENTSLIVMGEPAQRVTALEALRRCKNDWYKLLCATLPPDSMNQDGLNVRQKLIELLEMAVKVDNPEELTGKSVEYLRTRADFNAMLGQREPIKKKNVPRKINFVFRPLANPILIYSGNTEFREGKFKVAVSVPTPVGGLVFSQDDYENSFKYIVVEYDGTYRFIKPEQGSVFVVEDEDIFRVSTETRGEFLYLRIDTKKPRSIE